MMKENVWEGNQCMIKERKEIPSQVPVIGPQFPFEPSWIHVLDTEPLKPLTQVPLIVSPFANVWSHCAFSSFEISKQ